tara:strand:+ start:14641 stop:15147 length:507 start_codon:yes stop_codon:yes gene_type:complete
MIPFLFLFIFSACGTEAEPDIDPPTPQPQPDPVVDTSAEYSVTLTLSDDNKQIELRFGQHANPTSQDEQMPPPPPEGNLHAHFTKNSKNYWKDFRSKDSEAEVWDFNFQTGDNGTVMLEWNLQTTKFPGTLTLVNSEDDSSIEIDGTGEIELPISANGSFLFEYQLDE